MPGNPAVAERTVMLLREAERRGEITLEVVPGLSFADLAWSRLGVDPMDGARLVDGQSFAVDAAGLHGPLLIGHCINRLIALGHQARPARSPTSDAPVTVLQRLGTAAGAGADDRRSRRWTGTSSPTTSRRCSSTPDTTAVAGELAALVALSERLRAPGGCPWDAEQTHHSLSRYLLEEAYETVEAIEGLPADAPEGDVDLDAYTRLEDELGDLLYQVVFHSVLAAKPARSRSPTSLAASTRSSFAGIPTSSET